MKFLLPGFLCSMILLFQNPSFSQEVGIGQWRDHLPYDYATNVEEFNSGIYCSTPFSMFFFDRDDNSIQRLSKVNGLSDLGVSDIALNTDQEILVVSYSNTNVDLILEDLTIINIPDIKRKEILGNKTINSIMNYGKFAYLSCGFGIVVLNLEKKEVKDTYFIGPDGGSINVLAMTYNDTAFFAATENGIYYADINDPNLAYYANWKKMPGIPFEDGFYNLVYNYNGRLLINHTDPDINEDGLYVLENGQWRDLETANTDRTYSLRSSGDKLVVSYSYFLKSYNTDLTEDLKIYTYGEISPAPSDALIGTDGNYWIADRNKGLVKSWADGYERQFIKPSGAPTADIFEMASRDGKLYVVPGGLTATWNNTWRTARMFSLIDENWKTYDNQNSPGLDTLRDLVAVAVDPLNSDHVFAGSWNRGMAEFKDNAFTQIYNSDNSSLVPNMIEGYPTVKVGGMAFDSDNNMWITNSGAEQILSVRRPDGNGGGTWEAYNLGSSTTGIDVRKIIVDSYGQKWILPRTTQSNSNYIIVYNEKNDPGNQVRGLKSGAGFGNLPGTSVYAIAEDREGEIWVGTDEGVAVFYSPQNIFTGENADAQQILVNIDGYVQYLLETEIVKAIAVDGANRKWFGTERAGVFLLSADGTQQIQHFTEENSPLFSNNITSLTINGKTGEVFIGTAKGLISYKGTATNGDTIYDNVYAYPNPVRPGYTGPIAIKGLVRDASVKITDIRGSLIYETIAEGGQAIWNGYSFDGRRANTGVYLVFITNNDGSQKLVTKILFVN
ncbi:MAG: hypothetical protein M0Q51_15770 [Bacteroidales bacterium]|nr:hypothetical protein [Bacteroidales bacterium]